MKSGRLPVALVAFSVLTAASAGVVAQQATSRGNSFAHTILAEHNRARDDAGVPQLTWSPDLAEAADAWAKKLAREGQMRHSTSAERSRTGENLWMGMTGYYGAESMVSAFVAEKVNFVPGQFPEVSRTGRWEDVGHYTQVVWRDTREVGCALAQGETYEFLVCRYRPAGNWYGRTPF